MNKTIEERAIAFAEATPDCPVIFVANKAYTRGATDQVNIDIETFERFLDRHHLLCNKNQASAWNKLKKDMKGGEE